MHPHPRPGVDLADRAAGVAVALGDVGRQEVDAADVEPDRADRPLGHQLVVGMDHVGHVDRRAAGREVRGLAQEHHLALGRHARLVVALRGQHPLGDLVELEPGQHVLVPGAAARILVHRSRPARRPCCAPSPTTCPGIRRAAATSLPSITSSRWSSPRIMLSTITPAALVDRDLEGVRHLGVGRQVHRDPAPVVAVDRLHHHREADVAAPPRPRPRRRGRAAASAPAARGPTAAGCRAPCPRRSRPRCARSGWSAPPRSASGTCPGRPGSGWRRSAAPRGCRAPPPPAPAPAPTARASGARRSGRSPRSPRRCRCRRPRGRDQLEDDRPRHVAGLEPDLLELVAVEHLDLVLVRRGPREGDLGRRAAAVLQRDRHLRHQLAEPAVGVLQPLGQRLSGLGRARWRARAARRRAAPARRHSPTPASSARRCRSTVRRISGSFAKTFGPT